MKIIEQINALKPYADPLTLRNLRYQLITERLAVIKRKITSRQKQVQEQPKKNESGASHEKICIDCNQKFFGFALSVRCNPCRDAHNKRLKFLANQKIRERAKKNKTGFANCLECGVEFKLEHSRQLYCKEHKR